jgi:hypothetical protein
MINLSLPIGDVECDQLAAAVERFVVERGALFED